MEDNKNQKEIVYEDLNLDDCKAKLIKVRKFLKKYKQERQEYLEGWQRTRADFQNYKKEQENAMNEFRKFATARFAEKILPVLDNLSRACDSLPESLRGDMWAKGVINVRRQFQSILSECGVEEMKADKGDTFDPTHHEIIGEAAGEGASGTVAEVVEKGYTSCGKVIRPARVKVIK